MKYIKHLFSLRAARLAVLLAVLALAASVKGQSPNLVVNGGFETGDFTGWGLAGEAYVDDGSGFGISPHSGTFLADLMLGARSLGRLSQTLATTPGANYVISFSVNNYWQDPNQLQVSWNGSTVFGPTTISSTGWTNIQFQVTATGASTVLQFGFEDDEDALGLDDVSVELLPPSPIVLQAVAGNDQVTLTWTTSAGVKFDDYKVLRSTNSGGPWMQLGLVTSPPNSWTDGSLVNGTTYYYEVAGLMGGSPTYSSVVSATPVPYTYTTANGGITITGYAGTGGAVTIPNTINGLPVTAIGSGAFQNCASLTSVTIPASVTNLGGSAFASCAGLTGVYFQGNAPIPGGDSTVFSGDPATVYYLPGTTGWNAPTFDGRPAVLLNPPYLCTTAGAITIIGYTGSGGAVTIPDTINGLPVTSIGSGAFTNCASLTSVTIGTNVTSIADTAFQNCSSLASVTIGTNVTCIGNSAFQNCANLTSLTIPGSVTNLGGSAFASCAGLVGVYFQGKAPIPGGDSSVFSGDPATVYYLPGTTGWNAPTFDGRPAVLLAPPYTCTTANGAITIIGYTCTGGAVTIPDTINNLPVTAIGANAFNGCTSVTSVTIGTNITSIADTAFQNCSSLTGVYFLGNPPNLGSSVFANDNNALGYNAAGTTGWSLTFGGLTMVLANNSTINGINHYAYGANLGWVDWLGDTAHGAVIKTNVCSATFILPISVGSASATARPPTASIIKTFPPAISA